MSSITTSQLVLEVGANLEAVVGVSQGLAEVGYTPTTNIFVPQVVAEVAWYTRSATQNLIVSQVALEIAWLAEPPPPVIEVSQAVVEVGYLMVGGQIWVSNVAYGERPLYGIYTSNLGMSDETRRKGTGIIVTGVKYERR